MMDRIKSADWPTLTLTSLEVLGILIKSAARVGLHLLATIGLATVAILYSHVDLTGLNTASHEQFRLAFMVIIPIFIFLEAMSFNLFIDVIMAAAISLIIEAMV